MLSLFQNHYSEAAGFYVKCSVCNVQTLLGHPSPISVEERAIIVV